MYAVTDALNASKCKEKAARIDLCRKGVGFMRVRALGPEPGCKQLGQPKDTTARNTTRLMSVGALGSHCRRTLTAYVEGPGKACVSWKKGMMSGGVEQRTVIQTIENWKSLVQECASICSAALKDVAFDLDALLSDHVVNIHLLNNYLSRPADRATLNFQDLVFVAGKPPAARQEYEAERRICWEALGMTLVGVRCRLPC